MPYERNVGRGHLSKQPDRPQRRHYGSTPLPPEPVKPPSRLQFRPLKCEGYEKILSFYDYGLGMTGYIAVHNTKLGPGLGGCRIMPYKRAQDALLDVLRLSKGMTYKNSLAGLNFGGGKCVVISPKATPEIMNHVGEAVSWFLGKYIIAEDVGTSVDDIKEVAKVTKHVASLGGAGDPSPWTARGVMSCIRSAVDYKFGTNLTDKVVWVEGLGKVGWALAAGLVHEGALVYVTDIRPDVLERAEKELKVKIYQPGQPIDVYAPCAIGQIVNKDTVDSIAFPIICGSSNNQLVEDDFAKTLQANGVLYCPDYLVNAGGVINVSCEIGQAYDKQLAAQKVDALGTKLLEVIYMAEQAGITPVQAANVLAEKRLA
jgi:leucine dehydrogenase